jgi:OOP family OmpA-OmpF porin
MFGIAVVLSFALILASCATAPAPKPSFTPVDLASKVSSGEYEAKVDHFYMILDASSSMTEAYKGATYTGHSKFEVEKALVENMNQTMPPLGINGGMGAFGLHPSVSDKLAINLYGPKMYDQTEFGQALEPLTRAGGTTPMGDGIDVSMDNLKEVQGDVALLLFSDGMETSPRGVEAAKALKEAFGDRLCIYTVWVGNDPRGKARLEEIAEAGGCGFATTADDIMSPEGMASFVEQVFLQEAPPAPAPAPKITWILSDVNFDFDKWDLRPDAKETLNRDLAILKENPQIKVEIQGHTDDIGTAEYNQMLSEKRANSVMNYLVENGIDPTRLTAKGYGEERPRFPNDSEENRARNRRVEMVPFE